MVVNSGFQRVLWCSPAVSLGFGVVSGVRCFPLASLKDLLSEGSTEVEELPGFA